MARPQTTYKTRDLSIAAHLYAQGAKVRSIIDREFFIDAPNGRDAVAMALEFISSDAARYDQSVRALKKVILEWHRKGLVGSEGAYSIVGRMEVVAYLCHRGASIVGFERMPGTRRSYRTHFDNEQSWCESIIAEWGDSSAHRFDSAMRDLKRLSRGAQR